jgi:signal transduction histidine kinase
MDFDVQKLRQVMTNLLSNAVKFITEEGKVTVARSPRSRSVGNHCNR